MSKIRIKHFGPIKNGYLENDGWMDIKKVTVLIGNQGSGKSTLAKAISTLKWIEKAINRGDIKRDLSTADFFNFFEYQRIRNYFQEETEIEYIGERIHLKFKKGLPWPELKTVEAERYAVPKIMYVPAERNFLSVIENAYGLKKLPPPLFTFAEELKNSHIDSKGQLIDLPLGGLKFEYDSNNDVSYLIGTNYRINLLEASSGHQSIVPLFLVSRYLSQELKITKSIKERLSVSQSVRRNEEIAEIMLDDTMTLEAKDQKVKEIDSRYLNTCFVNIVEEPEQNLFPSSQWKLLQCLLAFNAEKAGSQLILTTHSPYIINYLTLAVKAEMLNERISSTNKSEQLKDQLNSIVPSASAIKPEDLVIYELDENDGSIKLLNTHNGLPSDENKLNERLEEGNELFARLLDIQQQL